MANKKLSLAQFNETNSLQGRHILIVESLESKRAIALKSSVFSIGRHPSNSLVLADKMVSRHHATIVWLEHTDCPEQNKYAYWVIDGMGKNKRSRNGIFINGQKKSLHRLVSEDIITIGQNIKIIYNHIFSNSDIPDSQYCESKKQECENNNLGSSKDTIIMSDLDADTILIPQLEKFNP